MRCWISLFLLISLSGYAQIPSGYYDDANGKTGYILKTSLHNIINGHTSYSYSAVWNFVNENDITTDNYIWDIYSDVPGATPPYSFTPSTDQCGTYSGEGDCYNREHSFPKSWFSDASPMLTDFHHLYATDGYVNGQRGNLPFGEVAAASWTSQNGSKRGSSAIAGYTGTVFEPIDEYKGDLARTYFYMATRYENLITGWSSDMLNGSSDQVYTSWALEMLLAWHTADPVSQKEIDRNNAIYGYQGNRNPFVDHPEYVCLTWACSGNSAPLFTSTTVGTATEDVAYSYNITTSDADNDALTITATTKPSWLTLTDHGDGTATLSGTPAVVNNGANAVVLEVTDGTDASNQSFSITVSAPGVNIAPLFDSAPLTTATEDTFYSYSITTSDSNADDMIITAPTKPSWLLFIDNGDGTATLSGTPTSMDAGGHSVVLNVSDGADNTNQSFTITVNSAGAAPNAWINEIHYDNAGADVGEFIEVVIEDLGYDLSLFAITLYNGSDGTSYGTSTIDTYTLGEQSGNFKIYAKAIPNIQNGSPDGMSLSYNGELIQFLSYEGSFTATNGVANGVSSTDIDVSESGVTAVGQSLQLCCNGTTYDDMSWQPEATATMGAFNTSQVLPVTLLLFDGYASDNQIKIHWKTASEVNNDKFIVEKSLDGTGFEVLEVVKGSGSTTTPQEYFIYDKNPDAVNYYRLKQVDFDGTSTTFQVIAVSGNTDNSVFRVYPNPVKDHVEISYAGINPKYNLSFKVIDIYGSIKMEYYGELEAGINTLKMGIPDLASGGYMLSISGGEVRFLERFLVE